MEQPSPQNTVMSFSSSPGEAVEAASDSPPPEDHKAHQNPLRKVISVLDIQAEEMCESSHKMAGILVLAAPARVVLPMNKAIMEPGKEL